MSKELGVILLVEGNADDIYLTRHAFERNDIRNEIIVARDGIEALDLLLLEDGSQPLCPVIVLLDINMPRMSGLELSAILRTDARTRSLPVIVLSTSTEDRDTAESYSIGANGYVPTPVSPDQFLAAAKALGVFWLGLNRQASTAHRPPSPEPRDTYNLVRTPGRE